MLPQEIKFVNSAFGFMRLSFIPILSLCFLIAPDAFAADAFTDKVLPFMKTYCSRCHNEKTKNGEFDLSRYTTAAKAIEDFKQWEHVVTFLRKEEMPPAESKQPPAELRAEMLKVVEGILVEEARKYTGDPGVVVPRRLTNSEFDNTIRDITGVDIRPTASFPLDPSSGEGFNNTGEALMMSPSLFKKYYGAAQQVADHALLTSTGLKFAPHAVTTFADRQKFYEQRILKFYEGHKVEYETYLTALWLYKYRAANDKATSIEAWAKNKNLSAKYMGLLWETLNVAPEDGQFYLSWLRQSWEAIPAPKNLLEPTVSNEVSKALKTLANDINDLSMKLCPPETPAIVANAGNSPVAHLDSRRKMAQSRDTFDFKSASAQRFQQSYSNVGNTPTIKLTIEIAASNNLKADGFVTFDGGFTTSNPLTANLNDAKKKKWTLQAILSEHAPDQLKKLTFGTRPDGKKADPDSLILKAPVALEIEIPAAAFNTKGNLNFFANCKLEGSSQGMVQVKISAGTPVKNEKARPSTNLFEPGHANAQKIQTSGEAFCKLFPNRFYFVDATRGLSAGFHLIEGFFRDDQPLYKLTLSDSEKMEIDQLWNDLYFVTDIWQKMLRGFVFFERSERSFLKHPDFDSIKEEDPDLTKEENIKRFKELYLVRSNVKSTGEELSKHPISIFFDDVSAGLKYRTETFKTISPVYLKNLEDFASVAYRRPLTDPELQSLRKFFLEINQNKELGIEQAVQASIVRILVSPYFSYRMDVSPAGKSVAALPDIALASRLSYFLWAGPPDAELYQIAASGKLHDEKVLREQTRRMLKDPKVSRFALEFFGQWLGYREFLKNEAVSREVFPTFDDALRQAMFEEPTRLAAYLIQQNKPITDLLSSDSTFVNKKLAQHYGLPFNGKADDWELVEGMQKLGRGGVMGMAVFLTKNSQPQRTSPVKRGFWVVSKMLGEHIPPPPADVAVLPAKETDTQGKTIRQLMVLHTDDNRCARCHFRFDSVGLAMEGFNPIGASRTKDLAGRPIDNLVFLPSGKEAKGVPEFSKHILSSRKNEFTKTLNQKLLGYALGRSLQLSDHSLLEKMQADLNTNEDKLAVLFETVITSPQFLNQRCRDFSASQFVNETKGNKP